MTKATVIGADFGTDSVRTVLIDAANGRIISAAVCDYPRWKAGRFCDPGRNQYRQHPLDYVESFTQSINQVLKQAPAGAAESVIGIGIDTTGSTPCALDQTGMPLALKPGFKENPNAMFILWKDHTAIQEAEEINAACSTENGTDYLKYVGGVYSSEWFWAKILHTIREDSSVREAAWSWAEHCDWMPALLTGVTAVRDIKRSRCAAGHKAIWHAEWGGLPPEFFWSGLDERLCGLRDKLYHTTLTANHSAGTLSKEWSKRLGLSPDVHVSVGAFDAHLGAVGAQIEPYHLCKVMGTSTCDILVVPMDEAKDILVRGICGQVDGSVLPGMLGLEAGQSSFGDVYAWFRDLLAFPLAFMEQDPSREEDVIPRILPALSEQAAALPVDPDGPVAVDWLNGRRTPDANQRLKLGLTGLDLSSDAAKIYQTLVQATAFGAKAIVDRFRDEGVPIHGIIGLGGVAKKNPFVLQTVCDVMGMPMRIARAEQAVALGSAMAAATAAGLYGSMQEAQEKMGHGFEATYTPDPDTREVYGRLYQRYRELGAFIELSVKDT